VILFDKELRFGRAVGVSVAQAADVRLPPAEEALAASFGPPRRATFVAGRVALRAALERSGLAAPLIGASPRGAPLLGPHALGSISHKHDVAVGLAAPRGAGDATIGVDVERLEPLRVDISRRILTELELEGLARSPEASRDRVVRVAFSMKEAIYKAIDPFVSRYVGFREVELPDVQVFGTARSVEVRVAQLLAPASPRALSIVAAYEIVTDADGELVLAEARAVPS
jgi:phosphopantetheine--protein transferase-like protein